MASQIPSEEDWADSVSGTGCFEMNNFSPTLPKCLTLALFLSYFLQGLSILNNLALLSPMYGKFGPVKLQFMMCILTIPPLLKYPLQVSSKSVLFSITLVVSGLVIVLIHIQKSEIYGIVTGLVVLGIGL